MGMVSPDDVKRVARLARVRLEGEALTQIAGQLDTILDYIQQLRSVPTDDVEPTSHVLPLSNVLRPDRDRPSLSQGDVMRLAPEAHPPFVIVPKMLD